MPIPAKPSVPVLQSNDTAAHARLFLPITESALPLTDLVSSTVSTIVGTGTAPTLASLAFDGVTSQVATFAAGQGLQVAARGMSIAPQSNAYCMNAFVCFRQTTAATTFNQILMDFDSAFGSTLAIRGAANNDIAFFLNGSAFSLAVPGLPIVVGHDYLLYFGYTFDDVNTCTAYYSLWDFTTGVSIPASAITQVGATNVYSNTGAAGTQQQVGTSATLPAPLTLGAFASNAAFGLKGSIYAAFFAESTSPANIWTQTQITELIADPLRSARAGSPTITFSGANTGIVGAASGTITATLSQALGGSGGTLSLASTDGSAVFTPSSLNYSSSATTATFTYTAAVSGNATITGSGSGFTTSTGGFVASPAAPTAPGATGGNAQVTVTFTTGVGGTGTNIYRGTTTGGESGTALATGITSPYVDSTAVNGTTYYYTLKATGLNSTISVASAEVSATPSAGPTVAPSTVTLAYAGTSQLTPSSFTGGAVTWSTSDATVATVNSSGLVTALSKTGSCIITATGVSNPAQTATCVVTVVNTYTFYDSLSAGIAEGTTALDGQLYLGSAPTTPSGSPITTGIIPDGQGLYRLTFQVTAGTLGWVKWYDPNNSSVPLGESTIDGVQEIRSLLLSGRAVVASVTGLSALTGGPAVAGSTASLVTISGLPSGRNYATQKLMHGPSGEARVIISQAFASGNYTFTLGTGTGESGPFSISPTVGDMHYPTP